MKRVNHGPVTNGRESFRQGRGNGGLPTKCNGITPEAGISMGSGNTSKDTTPHLNQSLNIDKPLHPSKGQMRR